MATLLSQALLRVPERITYKLCVPVYNCLHGMALCYLQDVIQLVAEVMSHHQLRSALSSALVVVATCHSTLGVRAFACWSTCMEQFISVHHRLLTTCHLTTYLSL